VVDARRRARGFGIRLDFRYVLRSGGVDFAEDELRSFFAASALTTVSF
jgi:hypothetical protein